MSTKIKKVLFASALTLGLVGATLYSTNTASAQGTSCQIGGGIIKPCEIKP